jgi:REP element-mobilizing transposase RayT
MPFVKVYIHFVWGTKNRYPYFHSHELRLKVWNHIREHSKEKEIFIDFISGCSDHCHCLISLGIDQTIEKTVMLLKGESSFWINKQHLTREKFAWQDEYFAVSISESMINNVREYIKNQEVHHVKKTFQQECDEFISKYGFEKFKE